LENNNPLTRIYDPKLIEPAVNYFLGKDHVVDLIDWISKPTNIVLVNDVGDLALFELQGTWQAHYYFNSRGRKAIVAGKNFLDEILNPCYNIKVLTGLTPLTNLRARWFNRQIGMKSEGVMTINDQPFELFMIRNSNI